MPTGPDNYMLLNSEGFWLKGMKKEDEWGFLFKDRRSRAFGSDFNDAWQKISKENSGQFLNKDGLFTFATVYPYLQITKGKIESETTAG